MLHSSYVLVSSRRRASNYGASYIAQINEYYIYGVWKNAPAILIDAIGQWWCPIVGMGSVDRKQNNQQKQYK